MHTYETFKKALAQVQEDYPRVRFKNRERLEITDDVSGLITVKFSRKHEDLKLLYHATDKRVAIHQAYPDVTIYDVCTYDDMYHILSRLIYLAKMPTYKGTKGV
jgi:hypothetical protein